MGVSENMLRSFLLSDAQLDYSGRHLFFSLDSGSRLAPAFQRQTSFGFVLLTHVMLS
jgi:hypothetical protein